MITYVAASYYPRFGDPIATAVALCKCEHVCDCRARGTVEVAVIAAAKYEQEELDAAFGEDDAPEIIPGMAFTYSAKDLFSAAELRECRRELMMGNVVWLYQ